MQIVRAFYLALMPVLVIAAPAQGKVVRSTPTSFVVEHERWSTASPDRVWAMLGQPSRWWSAKHSWSGKAANFSMVLKPGGCFCESLPNGGGVEHARVIMVAPGRMLRLSGALGPLQGEGVSGALTFTLKPGEHGGTVIQLRYAVNGDTAMPIDKIAAAVDGVIGEQLKRLTDQANGAAAAARE